MCALWDEQVCMPEGHYQLPIPWKDGEPSFPDNRFMAEKRLQHTMGKLVREGMLDKYEQGVQKMLSEGHAEEVPEEILGRSDGKVWYLPHFPVTSAAKPGKVRIVFDCAAKYQGISLNNQCLTGPDLVNKLVHVLVRFRQFQYAVTADIAAMYLQVRIPVADRDCLRFLWYVDGQIKEFRMTSHLFGGVWCAASSTYALRKVVHDFSCSELVRDTVEKSMYVDDLLKSVRTASEARAVVHDVRSTLKEGGFDLTKYTVNDPEIFDSLPKELRAQDVKEFTLHEHSKALGIRWDVNQDGFFYVCPSWEKEVKVTKRSMLKIVASLYDPLGLVVPIVMVGRMLFQEATRLGLTWDDVVPSKLTTKWSKWLVSMDSLSSLVFPRCIIPKDLSQGQFQLHHFCDASEKAYGAVTYLRVEGPNGEVKVSLLMAKGRVAPLKYVSIPRLELCSAVLAVKCDEMLRRELEIELQPSVFRTDSQVVLGYIHNETQRFKVFVANRTTYIRKHSEPQQWEHVSTKENPADVISRGCYVNSVPIHWRHGPSFLGEQRSEWEQTAKVEEVRSDDPEVRLHAVEVSREDQVHPLEELAAHYSSFYKLKKAVAWWQRFLEWLREKRKVSNGASLTASDLNQAEVTIVKWVQGAHYGDEIRCLMKGNPVGKASSLAALDPALQDGILVVGGRLKHSNLGDMARHPMILPKEHRISRLVLQEHHRETHLGTEWVLSLVRRRFWIPKARMTLRGIRRSCVVCQRLYGKTAVQKMADLPPDRCTVGWKCFQEIGLDVFGPIYTKLQRGTIKRYGCVYTCLKTRAIHLEVLSSLNTDAFLNGFFRFCARRGFPSLVRSDNGTNIVGAVSELTKAFRQIDREKVVRDTRVKGVEWVFNPPLASHHGGVYERQIRTVRRVLLAILGPEAVVSDDVLSTAFCEVENTVNSRPLTKCRDDPLDEVPLSPNHLLLLDGNVPITWPKHGGGDILRSQWKQVQALAAAFWRRWVREYIQELQGRQKWLREVPNFKKGDLVLMQDDLLPRGKWPLGIIQEVHHGRDGLVRSVRLSARGSSYVRPITKIVPLEFD